jgi:hypothetical protein
MHVPGRPLSLYSPCRNPGQTPLELVAPAAGPAPSRRRDPVTRHSGRRPERSAVTCWCSIWGLKRSGVGGRGPTGQPPTPLTVGKFASESSRVRGRGLLKCLYLVFYSYRTVAASKKTWRNPFPLYGWVDNQILAARHRELEYLLSYQGLRCSTWLGLRMLAFEYIYTYFFKKRFQRTTIWCISYYTGRGVDAMQLDRLLTTKCHHGVSEFYKLLSPRSSC